MGAEIPGMMLIIDELKVFILVIKTKKPSIFDYEYEDFELVDYKHHPGISAPIAVLGQSMREYDSSSPARPCLGAIWAQTDAGIIGRDGTMPWRAPEDLAHFKTVTVGKPVHSR